MYILTLLSKLIFKYMRIQIEIFQGRLTYCFQTASQLKLPIERFSDNRWVYFTVKLRNGHFDERKREIITLCDRSFEHQTSSWTACFVNCFFFTENFNRSIERNFDAKYIRMIHLNFLCLWRPNYMFIGDGDLTTTLLYREKGSKIKREIKNNN